MATVILARHGRTAANATGVLVGRAAGVGLDEVGTAQAVEAAERLAGIPLAAVATSPLQRCRETARLLAPGVRAVLDKGLVECDYGEWSGKSLKVLAKDPLWRVVQQQPSAVRFPGGEALTEVAARAVTAIRQRDAAIEAEHGPDAVWLAVSHGDVLKSIVGDALGQHLDLFQRIVIDPASLSVIRYTPERAFLICSNSRAGSLAHLAAPAKHRGRAPSRRRRGDAEVGGGAGS